MIAISKRSMSLLPQKEAVRIELEPFDQETLAMYIGVKMADDNYQHSELNSPFRVIKT